MSSYSKEEWTFQKNIYGVVLLLYSVTYISNHAIAILALKGTPKALFHYSGEIILIFCAVAYVSSSLLSKKPENRGKLGFFYEVPLFFWLGFGGVVLNSILLILSIILGRSEK